VLELAHPIDRLVYVLNVASNFNSLLEDLLEQVLEMGIASKVTAATPPGGTTR
jgi:hypothetical protein